MWMEMTSAACGAALPNSTYGVVKSLKVHRNSTSTRTWLIAPSEGTAAGIRAGAAPTALIRAVLARSLLQRGDVPGAADRAIAALDAARGVAWPCRRCRGRSGSPARPANRCRAGLAGNAARHYWLARQLVPEQPDSLGSDGQTSDAAWVAQGLATQLLNPLQPVADGIAMAVQLSRRG